MSFIFDTNIIIAFMKNETAIVDFFSKTPIINVSPITIGEMYFGARKSNNQEKNLQLYHEFFKYCNVLKISEKTANHYSDIKMKLKRVGKPIPENDLWIASNAMEHSLIIASRDKHLLSIDFIDTLEL